MMLCPSCNEPLVVYELDLIELDHCPDCGGTWLDHGELEEILCGEKDDAILKALEGPAIVIGPKRKCPICRTKMELIEVGNQPKVQIDRCKLGHGLWFDKNELKQIVKQFSEGSSNKVTEFLGDLYYDEIESEENKGD